MTEPIHTTPIKTANLIGSVSRNAGGLYESVRKLVWSLDRQGLDVKVFGIEDNFTSADVSAWEPVPVTSFKPSWPHAFGYSPKFYNELEEYAPEIIHTHGIWMYQSVAAAKYSKRHNRPYVISPHGMVDPWAIRNSRLKKVCAYWLYEQRHLKNATCLRALCESEARSMRQFGLTNPIAIIPNGIDIPEPQNPASVNKPAPWAGLIDPGKKVMLFLSRIHPKKGLPNLLRAWSMVPQADWVLAIAGWDQGGHEAELKKLCSELRISFTDIRDQKPTTPKLVARPTVIFLGPQFKEDKATCYVHCDGFVLPSFSEGLPMVVLEAWAHGKPVLMTPECNLPVGFKQGAAIQIETTPKSIAEGLSSFFSAPEASRKQMGEKGLILIREFFTWPKIGNNLIQVYNWILKGGKKPACVTDY